MAETPADYSVRRATAVHEAGHAVMSYLLRRPFADISVVEEDTTFGRVRHAPPGEWFRPDIEVNARTRRMVEDHVMICLAGAETEASWCRRLPDAPGGWQEHVNAGSEHDLKSAIDLADYFCGSVPELEAYLEWLRQRVLGSTGWTGDGRFWSLVTALADVVQETGSLTWRRARVVLRSADRDYFSRTSADTTDTGGDGNA